MADFLNIIIRTSSVQEGDRELLFPDDEMVHIFDQEQKDIFDLLIILGAFPSKSQARKNWNGPKEIPEGWSEFFVGKLKRHLCIWNPSE